MGVSFRVVRGVDEVNIGLDSMWSKEKWMGIHRRRRRGRTEIKIIFR